MTELEIKSKDETVKFKGIIEIFESEEDYVNNKPVRVIDNLMIDDGKEMILDFLGGITSWWNPKSTYTGGDSGWDTTRYIGYGECMFNNASFARASGLKGIASGTECSFPVATIDLVSPEDSFLSTELGVRIIPTITRRDQTLEVKAEVAAPGNLEVGDLIREFGFFLSITGPTNDPSSNDLSKSKTMVCRAPLYGTGYYRTVAGVCEACSSTDAGATLCYFDDYYEVLGDIKLRWRIGEL